MGTTSNRSIFKNPQINRELNIINNQNEDYDDSNVSIDTYVTIDRLVWF